MASSEYESEYREHVSAATNKLDELECAASYELRRSICEEVEREIQSAKARRCPCFSQRKDGIVVRGHPAWCLAHGVAGLLHAIADAASLSYARRLLQGKDVVASAFFAMIAAGMA
eukprot:3626098-Pleurochrysis_carterae.AAC.2